MEPYPKERPETSINQGDQAEKPKVFWAALPGRTVLYDLTITDWRVFHVVSFYDRKGARGLPCFLSREQIAKLARVTTRTVTRSLQRLLEWGLIESAPHPYSRRANAYRVVFVDDDRRIFLDLVKENKGGNNGDKAVSPNVRNNGDKAVSPNSDPDADAYLQIGDSVVPYSGEIGDTENQEIEQDQSLTPDKRLTLRVLREESLKGGCGGEESASDALACKSAAHPSARDGDQPGTAAPSGTAKSAQQDDGAKAQADALDALQKATLKRIMCRLGCKFIQAQDMRDEQPAERWEAWLAGSLEPDEIAEILVTEFKALPSNESETDDKPSAP